MGAFGPPSFWEIFMNAQIRSSDVVTATGTGGSSVTATLPAATDGQSTYVTMISGGYSGASTRKTLQLKSDSNVIATFILTNNGEFVFTSPIKLPPGTTASVTLQSGSGNTYANIAGYTV